MTANAMIYSGNIDENYIHKFSDPHYYYNTDSLLEDLVQIDMRDHGINYPYCEVEAVKNYWKERLE